MKCNTIDCFSNGEIFTQIIERMDNPSIATLKIICSAFQKFANIFYLKNRFISSSLNEPVYLMKKLKPHSVAANIFITGYQNPHLYNPSIGYVGGSGFIYDLATGRAKKIFLRSL